MTHASTPADIAARPVRVDPFAADAARAPVMDAVERRILEIVRDAALPDRLRESIEYSAMAPGKRLRPMLAVRAAEAVGGAAADAVDAAAAVELIHAFSLVHDDLPAMDDDDLRRGRPTNHIVFGETMAILAGDAMVTLAFGALARDGVDPALCGLLTSELARGATGMIAGQVYDTLGGFPEGLELRERLELIHRNKTGALIRAACRMGAIAAMWPRLEQGRLAAVSTYGDAIGLMFQVVDDLLDVEQTAEHLGKRAGKDEDAGKTTFPGVVGIDASRAEVARLLDQSLRAIDPLGPAANGLRALAEKMASRDR